MKFRYHAPLDRPHYLKKEMDRVRPTIAPFSFPHDCPQDEVERIKERIYDDAAKWDREYAALPEYEWMGEKMEEGTVLDRKDFITSVTPSINGEDATFEAYPVPIKKRCQYELCVEKYFGLPASTLSEFPLKVTYGDLVAMLCYYDQDRLQSLNKTTQL
jgi:hypothetical protein